MSLTLRSSQLESEADMEVDHVTQQPPAIPKGDLNAAPSNSAELSETKSEVDRLRKQLAPVKKKSKRQERYIERLVDVINEVSRG